MISLSNAEILLSYFVLPPGVDPLLVRRCFQANIFYQNCLLNTACSGEHNELVYPCG